MGAIEDKGHSNSLKVDLTVAVCATSEIHVGVTSCPALNQHDLIFADEGSILQGRLFMEGLDELLQTAVLDVLGDIIDVVAMGMGLLAQAVRKHKGRVESDLFHQAQRILVLFLGLAAKANY